MVNDPKKMKHAAIHEILPNEIFEKILKNLGYKDIQSARNACVQWRKVVDGVKLMKIIKCKFDRIFSSQLDFFKFLFKFFSKNVFNYCSWWLKQ